MPQSNQDLSNSTHKKQLEQLDNMFDQSPQNTGSNSLLIILAIVLSCGFFIALLTLFFLKIT